MVLFRRLLGDVLRRHRQDQGRTLRDVAASARISLGYLSEIERGRKEASSELLGSLCEALDVSLADVLREVSEDIVVLERTSLARVTSMPPVVSMPSVSIPVSVPATPGGSTSVSAHRIPVAAA